MMGLSGGRKSFPIGLAVLIQYRSVTASHPAMHVAVAITLNAKASSLKKLPRGRFDSAVDHCSCGPVSLFYASIKISVILYSCCPTTACIGSSKHQFYVPLLTQVSFILDDVKLAALKVKVNTLDIAPLRSESPPQKRSGRPMARVIKGFHSFTRTPTRSSAIGMSHTCLCLPSRSCYSFTDPGGTEG